MINYSFQNGICEESAGKWKGSLSQVKLACLIFSPIAAFAVNGFFEIFLREDFEEGRRWGNVALKIMGANSAFIPREWICVSICTNYGVCCLYRPNSRARVPYFFSCSPWVSSVLVRSPSRDSNKIARNIWNGHENWRCWQCTCFHWNEYSYALYLWD